MDAGDAGIKHGFITYKRDGAAGILTLRHEASRNRISEPMAAEIRNVCQTAREDETLRALVVTGAGEVFSTGREPIPEEITSGTLAQRQEWMERRRVADAVASLPLPVIVSVNGDALDHGLELALAGDIRICGEEARFGLTDLSKQGRFPWDGGTQRLPRLVGPAWALDMLLTGRVISAAEALSIGLVNKVVSAGDLARETQLVVDAIAAGGPIAARYAKEAVGKGIDLGLAEGLRLEADLNVILQSTEDRAEGLRSFREKRRPRFMGR